MLSILFHLPSAIFAQSELGTFISVASFTHDGLHAHTPLPYLQQQTQRIQPAIAMSSPPSLSLSEKRPLLSRPTPKNTLGKSKKTKAKPVLVIHGGAGTITREGSTPERQEAYKKALRAALVRGYEVLEKGGEAMDAAVEAVGVMEGTRTRFYINTEHAKA